MGTLVLTLASAVGPSALAQIQNPEMFKEPTKDTGHVNEDLVPERSWELIQDPWIDPDNPAVIKLNPDDPMLTAFQKRRDLSAYPKREPGLINVHRYDLHMENVGVPTLPNKI